VLLLLLSEASVNVIGTKPSFQSGRMNGALYAGGMDYSENFLYVTGISYATNGNDHTEEAMCFVSKFRTHMLDNHVETISGTIGNGTKMNSCHSIGVMDDPKLMEKIVVAGTDQTSGGFIMEVEPSIRTLHHHSSKFRTRVQKDSQKVSYPIRVLYVGNNDSPGDGNIYAASLTSSDSTANPSNSELMEKSNDQPNWLEYYKAGNSFQMRLQKFNVSTIANQTTVEEVWHEDFFTLMDSAGIRPDVFVGGMILYEGGSKDNPHPYLIVAGSTSGSGPSYGNNEPGSDDEDGFITVVRADTGKLPARYNSTRVGTAKTDLILGICDDPSDHSVFYIVGSTGDPQNMGDQVRKHHMALTVPEGSLHGFIQKRKRHSLEKVWGVTWGAKLFSGQAKRTVTAGVDCKVLNDGTVYLAGVVDAGGHVLRDHENEVYSNNIVAMSLKSSTGEVNWVKQIGSVDGNENLARSGSIAVEPNTENMILFGDTTGSMFRHREDESDNTSGIFLVNLIKSNGNYAKNIPEKPVDSSQSDAVEETQGMLSGGDWKDDEVYGHSEWFNKDGMGIQSGPTVGSVFAGGMVYDRDEEAAYVTGIAYDGHGPNSKLSSCMVTKIPLNPSEFFGWASATGKIIGEKDVLEVCFSIALHGYGEVINVGYADVNSTLVAGEIPSYGFAMALDRYTLEEVDIAPLLTGKPNSRFQYPINVLSDGNDIYILSLTSTDIKLTREFKQVMNSGGANRFAPNWINMQKYGSSFYMTVTKVTLSEDTVDGVSFGGVSFTERWVKEFPIDSDGFDANTIPRVFIGGAILKKSKGYLALSGSTRGKGKGYGTATGEDEDGFITLLDMNTGELSTTVQKNNIRKGTDKDDFVLGICHDPNDDTSFYVVGGTEGLIGDSMSDAEIVEGSTQAFMMKINADSLETTWAVHLGAIHKNSTSIVTTVKAFDCAVQGDTVYFAGIVDDNASIVRNTHIFNSRGGDDIWLGSFTTKDGKVNWLRQMGSDGNDHLAPRGAIAIKKNGNVVLFGDTSGEFYREHMAKRTINELFMLEVTKSGGYKPHVKHHKNKALPGPNTQAPAITPVTPTTPASIPKTTAPPFLVNPSEELSKKKGLSTGVLVSMIVIGVIVCICLLVCVVFFRKRSGRRYGAETSNIQVKDGIIAINKFRDSARAPPSSSFQHADESPGYSDETQQYSDNLRIEDKSII